MYFYHCADDGVVSISHMHDYRKHLPHASFRVVESGGHQFNNNLTVVAEDIKSLFG